MLLLLECTSAVYNIMIFIATMYLIVSISVVTTA